MMNFWYAQTEDPGFEASAAQVVAHDCTQAAKQHTMPTSDFGAP
jgi:hypothetical protein